MANYDSSLTLNQQRLLRESNNNPWDAILHLVEDYRKQHSQPKLSRGRRLSGKVFELTLKECLFTVSDLNSCARALPFLCSNHFYVFL